MTDLVGLSTIEKNEIAIPLSAGLAELLFGEPEIECYNEPCEKSFKPKRHKTWKIANREFCSGDCLKFWLMVAEEYGYQRKDFE